MLRSLQSWIDERPGQRLKPMEKLARMLLDYLEGILNHCRTKLHSARRAQGYRARNYLLPQAHFTN
jgi:transposase